jgi:hypothetical protein
MEALDLEETGTQFSWNLMLLSAAAYTLIYMARYLARALELIAREIIYTKYPEMAFLLLVILGSIYRERMGLSLGIICVEPLGL